MFGGRATQDCAGAADKGLTLRRSVAYTSLIGLARVVRKEIPEVTTKHHALRTATLSLTLIGWTACHAEVLHVSPTGTDRAPGTAEQPLSLRGAIARASGETSIREVVLAGGEYLADNLNFRTPLGADPAKWPPLRIHAKDGQIVTLCHSVSIAQAKPVDGLPGVYCTDQIPPGEPNLWERDTRTRYVSLATKSSVAAYPGSCFADPEGEALYFHSSDGEPPETHEQGVRVKATPGRYAIRHNTIVDCHVGVCWVTDNSNSDTSHNVIVNAEDFIRVARFDVDFTLDHNLFWQPRDAQASARRTEWPWAASGT